MIIDSSQGNIEVIGDIQEFKISIDPKNLEFITTLLSSNLYSNPEQSFIREIVSNAWDSHVEANTTDLPVIVKITKENDAYNITVRDFGTGLSPERFKEIYCNIGSSTKRDTNDYIGGFGIGRFSALACSNSVYITSYYKGTAYLYIMVKSGNTITTNLIYEKSTEEKDGVEVTIKGIKNVTPFMKALSTTIFFPNLYVESKINLGERFTDYNQVKIKRFKHIAAASILVGDKILLGNVLYPIDLKYVTGANYKFIRDIQDSGIVIMFNVGELCVTPNRESIIYTSETIDLINARIQEAQQELFSQIDKYFTKDCTSLKDYYKNLNESFYFDPLLEGPRVKDLCRSYFGYRVVPTLVPDIKLTFKGNNFIKYYEALNKFYYEEIINFKGYVDVDKIVTKLYYSARDKNTYRGYDKLLILQGNDTLTPTVKNYIKLNYNKYTIVSAFSKGQLLSRVKDSLANYHELVKDNQKDLEIIVEGIYEDIINNSVTLNTSTDAGFLNYKKELKESNKNEKKVILKNIILWVWNHDLSYRDKKIFYNIENAVKYIKSLKTGVILSGMELDGAVIEVAKFKNYKVIQVNQEILRLLKDSNITCLIDPDYLLYESPLLSKCKTVYNYFPASLSPYLVEKTIEQLPKLHKKSFKDISIIFSFIRTATQYAKYFNREKVSVDPSLKYYCVLLASKARSYEVLAEQAPRSGYTVNEPYLIAGIIKSKAYRVNYNTYCKYKNDSFLKLLCQK